MRATADLAEAANDLEDNENGSNDKEIDGRNKVVRTVLGLVLERDDEQHRNEDEPHGLAGPREIERHERAQLGRHEDLNNNDVEREDAACRKEKALEDCVLKQKKKHHNKRRRERKQT